MKAFVDTSSLIKKYIEETGSNKLDEYLEKIDNIIISPITKMEVNSTIERKIREKTLTIKESEFIEKEFKTDYIYFGVINWNTNLEELTIKLIRKHQIKVLDGIQLASGILSKMDIFLTSDERLFKIAKLEIKNTVYI